MFCIFCSETLDVRFWECCAVQLHSYVRFVLLCKVSLHRMFLSLPGTAEDGFASLLMGSEPSASWPSFVDVSVPRQTGRVLPLGLLP